MLGVPEKANGLLNRQAISFDSAFGNRTAVRILFGKQSRFAENRHGCYIGGSAVYAAFRSCQTTMPLSFDWTLRMCAGNRRDADAAHPGSFPEGIELAGKLYTCQKE
jgi:hypothetical protein